MMKTFPLFLKTSGRRVIIIGGGEQAAAKTRLLLKTDADLTVVSELLDPELHALAASGRIIHDTAKPTPGYFRAGDMVLIAREGCRTDGLSDAEIAGMARTTGALVNAVDQQDLCDFYVPSIVDRNPVVVAIGTEGNAPLLARQIKVKIEAMLEPRLGELAALAGRLRSRVAEQVEPRYRRSFWNWVFTGAPRRTHAKGLERDAARMIKQAIAAGGIDHGDKAGGFVSLVGAGPGSRDLITLRAVQRLQEADVIFYDRLVDPDVLELARRDAERVFVGKAPGVHAWPQEKINGVIASAAKQGMRVVRLKCGDPGIFGRVGEEIACLNAAGGRPAADGAGRHRHVGPDHWPQAGRFRSGGLERAPQARYGNDRLYGGRGSAGNQNAVARWRTSGITSRRCHELCWVAETASAYNDPGGVSRCHGGGSHPKPGNHRHTQP